MIRIPPFLLPLFLLTSSLIASPPTANTSSEIADPASAPPPPPLAPPAPSAAASPEAAPAAPPTPAATPPPASPPTPTPAAPPTPPQTPPPVTTPPVTSGKTPFEGKTAYAQFYSLETQMPASGMGNLIKLEQTRLAHNFELSPSKELILVKGSGIYLIAMNAQVATQPPGSDGYVDCWLIKNGKQVMYSNNRQSVEALDAFGLMNASTILRLEAGDTLGLILSASGPSLGIVSERIPQEPAMTSVDFMIYKID